MSTAQECGIYIYQNGNASLMLSTIHIDWCQQKWQFLRPEKLESLWEAIADDSFADDERLPYWVEIWPASLALAAFLQKQQQRIQGKLCLDLGCGLGFTALVGARYGARVLGIDYELQALHYAVLNTRHNSVNIVKNAHADCANIVEKARDNGIDIVQHTCHKNTETNGAKNIYHNSVGTVTWAVMDWRMPAVQKESCDFVWAGDIMYEQRFVEPVFNFLQHALKKTGCAWIAEPNRNIFNAFKECLQKNQWQATCVQSMHVSALHEQKTLVSVDIWQLEKSKKGETS